MWRGYNMKNIDVLKQKICDRIMNFTADEMYELLVGDNPFRILLCEKCKSVFGVCPENLNGDELCKKRFRKWCKSKNLT